MTTRAPIELSQIGLDPHAFTYSDKKSFRGPCPQCGGVRRFVIFTDKPFPLYYGYCDLCGCEIKAWQKVRVQFDHEQAAAFEAQRAREEAEKAEKRKAKLAEFTTRELWLELQSRMSMEQVDWWESQGIPQDIQKYLHIGYTPDKVYYDDNKQLSHSDAFTIPWFGQGFQFLTMQYRLLAPHIDRRYIFENDLGGGRFYYMTEPDKPIGDKVIICEGAKKAIVTQFWLIEDGFTVLGCASANTFDAALHATKDCGLRYIVTDPGADYWLNKYVATNKKTTHAVRLPAKIDDMWIKYGLDRSTFTGILQNAL